MELASFLEGRQDATGAAGTIDAVYRENSRILGVVRAATDYYWRNKNANRAIEILSSAAVSAHPVLRRQLTLEAALKAAQSGQQAKARQLLGPLLAKNPLNAGYLSAMADTFSREGDDKGLYTLRRARERQGGRRSDLPAAAQARSGRPNLRVKG